MRAGPQLLSISNPGPKDLQGEPQSACGEVAEQVAPLNQSSPFWVCLVCWALPRFPFKKEGAGTI